MKRFPDSTVIWEPTNVYETAKIGANCSVGMFSEIGHHVCIGDNTRVGMGTFICEGVSIGDDCFIGPRVCFTNDKYPPNTKDNWQRTYVKNGASIGANCTILPNVVIGENATVGAGSVVTKDIPANEVWCGNPAKFLRAK